MTHAKISHLGSTPVGTKTPDPKRLTRPMESSKRKEKAGKEHVPEDPESDPPSSDSSSSESDSSDDRKYSKSKSKRCYKKKKRRKRMKQDSSDSSSSNSNFSDEIDYKSKIRNKKKSYRKKEPIKLCAKLTAKLLTTTYKLKIVKFKLDEYPFQRRIYFLTFIKSLDMIFSQYKETCEAILDYPKIGWEDINIFLKGY